jgi:hypothetical protein
MAEVLFAELVGGVAGGDGLFFEGFEFVEYFRHAFYAGVVFVVVAEHFEDDFEEGEEILVGFEAFEFGGVPDGEDVGVDAPDDVVEDV